MGSLFLANLDGFLFAIILCSTLVLLGLCIFGALLLVWVTEVGSLLTLTRILLVQFSLLYYFEGLPPYSGKKKNYDCTMNAY